MVTKIFRSTRTSSIAAVLLFGLCSFSHALLAVDQAGKLQLTIVDSETGQPVPARVEIQGADGTYHVAEDALLVGGDCDMSDQGAGYVDLASTLAGFTNSIDNPYTQSTQFYSDGTSSISLPPGRAAIKVFKGSEYRGAAEQLEIGSRESAQHTIVLRRWINMPDAGWYSADGHLHIPRPVKELNPYILKMMQAEDIHVANLLQMGKVRNPNIAPQHAHGAAGQHQQGIYVLAAGQENPRTHFLGHTISLGADTVHHNPDKYLIYRLLWQETAKQGGLNGYAHAYWPNGSLVAPQDGMAVVLPHNLLHFVEVLQFNRSGYETWYDILNLGFRVTPTAGTDYPCADQTLPGHERFYTKVEGPLTYANWLKGVRNGRTFVTTGPIVEFRVDGQEIGSNIILAKPMSVKLTGKVVFDPEQDDLSFVEVVHNGNVIKRISRVRHADNVEFTISHRVDEASWFAVRGYGSRINENTFATPVHWSSFKPTSNVHSAPIYVGLKGQPGIEKSTRSRSIAATWLARLEDLQTVLAENNLDQLAKKLQTPEFDDVPKETLVNNRTALLEEIRVAKEFFGGLSQADP
jgi:hypothetical protein